MIDNWERLRVMDAVARAGSISGAAERLHVSASAVTQQLRRLQDEIGIAVVAPDGRGIRLTEAGRALAKTAAQVSAAVTEVEGDLAARTGKEIGQLRLGAAMTSLPTLLAPALARLTREHPSLEPHIVDGEARDYVEAVSESRLDAAIVESWPEDEVGSRASLAMEELAHDPVDLAVPMASDYSGLGDALDAPWAVCPPGSGAYPTLRRVLRRAGREPDLRYRLTSYPAQFDLVARGLCVALAPRLAQAALPPGVRIVALSPALARRLMFVNRRDDDRRIVAELFAALRREGAARK